MSSGLKQLYRHWTERRQFKIPESIQISSMDCGPAALKSILAGFGLDLGYPQIRQLCSTSADGASIDTLEQVALDLGIECEQNLVLNDDVFINGLDNLPAIVPIELPAGDIHFICIWRKLFGYVQVMDPQRGRYWVKYSELVNKLHQYTTQLDIVDWQQWFNSEIYQQMFLKRLTKLGFNGALEVTFATAGQRENARESLFLDALLRYCLHLRIEVKLSAEAVEKVAQSLLRQLADYAAQPWLHQPVIPDGFWPAQFPKEQLLSEEHPELVNMSGAVVLHFSGYTPAENPTDTPAPAKKPSGEASLFGYYYQQLSDNQLTFLLTIACTFVTALGIALATLLLRVTVDLSAYIHDTLSISMLMPAIMGFFLLMVVIELPSVVLGQWFGRRLELLNRLKFFHSLTRISAGFINSRPISDLSDRSHQLAILRDMPTSVVASLRFLFEMFIISAAILYFEPRLYGILIIAIGGYFMLPWLNHKMLKEKDFSVKTHSSAANKVYLEALKGNIVLKLHGGENAILRESLMRICGWAESSMDYLKAQIMFNTLAMGLSYSMSALVLYYFAQLESVHNGFSLLLLFWILTIPGIAEELVNSLAKIPRFRSITIRLREMTELDTDQAPASPVNQSPKPSFTPSSLKFVDLSITRFGCKVIEQINIEIKAGEQVAIVGASGAGKSSLLSILSGAEEDYQGDIWLNDKNWRDLDQPEFFKQSVWITPQVWLFNDTILHNLLFDAEREVDLNEVLNIAALSQFVSEKEAGLQTPIGENGGLLSGGEGQRIRMARGVAKSNANLVILDEAFRGLERSTRQSLLALIRKKWPHSTLLNVSHDINEVLSFKRVLVMHDGRVIEDADPNQLILQKDSHFYHLAHNERGGEQHLQQHWQKIMLSKGNIDKTEGSHVE